MNSEKRIIEAVKNGQVEAYTGLVKKHSSQVYALALSLLKNREDAEEITQNVFLKAYQALDKFRGDAKFSSFLYRICYNESMNRLRSRKIEVNIDDVNLTDESIHSSFFQVQQEERKKFLTLALDRLKSDYRMLLTLFYLKEMSNNEIVEITGMSLGNVKTKLHRARKALASVINELLKDEAKNLY